MSTRKIYAMKIVDKQSLVKPKAQAKIRSEIEIHRSCNHENVVHFYRDFEDDKFVYILLALCESQTLMELLKRRKRLSEEETMLYMLDIVCGTMYMHRRNIIHRDLKLGNLLLDRDLKIKIGDFGLAAKLRDSAEKKRTLCGTPNYIAPEVLQGRHGHSFEVDLWSIGVILYTMLIGKPPFETSNVKSTYKKIQANLYSFPPSVTISANAKSLITKLLSPDPVRRPSLESILQHPFMRGVDKFPRTLPTSSLHSVPSEWIGQTRSVRTAAGASSAYDSVDVLGERKPLAQLKSLNAANVPGDVVGSGKGKEKTDAWAYGGASAGSTRPSSSRPGSKGIDLGGYGSSSAKGSSAVPTSKVAMELKDELAALRSRTQAFSAASRATTAASGSTRYGSDGSAATARPSSSSAVPAASKTAKASSNKSSGRSDKDKDKARRKRLDDDLDEDERGALHDMHQHIQIGFATAASPSSTSPSAAAAYGAAADEPLRDVPPPVWVTKWVDYSNKYGLGYQLSDNTMGVYFNDSTKIVLAPADPTGQTVEYYERKRSNGQSYDEYQTFKLASYPESLQKKVTLLKHFKNYLIEHTAGSEDKKASDSGSSPASSAGRSSAAASSPLGFGGNAADGPMVYVKKWMLTRHAIIFRLSNKTVQVNFFDHTKIILSSEAKLVTYVNKQRQLSTYHLSTVLSKPRPELSKRLKYAKDLLYQLISDRKGDRAASSERR